MELQLIEDLAAARIRAGRCGRGGRLAGRRAIAFASGAEGDRADHKWHGEDGRAATERQKQDEGLGKSHFGAGSSGIGVFDEGHHLAPDQIGPQPIGPK